LVSTLNLHFHHLQGKLFNKDEEEEIVVQAPLQIGVPTNVTHEGHISFDKNEGFKVRSEK
jgi:hypothetical protein